jgi:16S rRNA (guanine966-N2)-methyltransferase
VLECVQTGVCEDAYRTIVARSEEMARSGKAGPGQSRLRIIGGKWRGRKLTFTPASGLRPTTDRVRETLFNWLAPSLQQARCLDLFTGSGALGLEALSRGASHCDFVDTSSPALAQISEHLLTLQATADADFYPVSALQFLQAAGAPYDIVFIDPPFGRELVEPACTLLADRQLLATGAQVYVEMATTEPCPQAPANWTLHRDKIAGGVAYRLFTVEPAPAA